MNGLRLSSNIFGTNKTNFPHHLLITDRQGSSRKAFVNNSTFHIKLSKTQLSDITESSRFLGRHFRSLRKVSL